ncbi:bacteriohemerythrin [Anaeromassilibacillus sp. An200]|uniref:bacteriohemerythrin n=1 Tax=Anaeromassilibacillus sp. An200 TaxID=1965587 RepID=UPI000B38811D|nr:hemerythrin family protein [Anaeromassilibacillus sp. An200]OUP10601.1 cation-binding protein [Anaeromassilibacillus sp. An200]
MKYELTPDLLTGNALIDTEHRQLFQAINQLTEDCEKGKGRDSLKQTAGFLVNYVAKHFADEERLQTTSKYPGYPTHKQFHESYKEKLSAAVGEIEKNGPTISTLGKFNGVVAILISHIRVEDKRLAAHIKQHS